MFIDGFVHQLPDIDPAETSEWLDSLDSVVDVRGKARARYLLTRLMERAREQGVGVPSMVSTPYINTIPPEQEPWFPGDEHLERRIRAFIRWNAVVMVARANRRFEGLGGHLSTYASAAALYEVGFNHFFRGKGDGGFGDQVFMQGHAAPGIYARAFLEGRMTEADLDRFRQEIGGGLPSYPHPRRLPDFWEFPTVSMGLGPINAIAQARFNRYLLDHEIADTSQAKVWCFVGDGEMDEPESTNGLSIAARESLDNLIFVVNCNLQRLDGPVRGNGKIIQELEAIFRGAGWNVIKVVWGREWDDLLARDSDGVLVNKMNTTVDGEFQKYAVESGAYIREHFFGPDPRLRKMVEHLSDDELRKLSRGGHDYRKLYAAYKAAAEHEGTPTVILAKTIKGWTLGPDFEARNATHQIKKMTEEELKTFRDRLFLDIPDEVLEGDAMPPYYHPGIGSPEHEYMMARRRALDGSCRCVSSRPNVLPPPTDRAFSELLAGTGEKVQASTTTAFARLLRKLLAEPESGEADRADHPRRSAHVRPRRACSATSRSTRRSASSTSPSTPGSSSATARRRRGRILEEGITEAGSMASCTAVGHELRHLGRADDPVLHLLFDVRVPARRRPHLELRRPAGPRLPARRDRGSHHAQGEGLQHCDGQSHVLASTVPNCRAYDPAFAYEMAVIIRDGIKRMYGDEPEDCFYYLTLYNENYTMPLMPEGVEDGILRGLYRYRACAGGAARTAPRSSRAAQRCAAARDRAAVPPRASTTSPPTCGARPSYKLLREDALSVERWNRLHPTEPARTPYVTEQLGSTEGPIVAVTDFMKAVPDQIGAVRAAAVRVARHRRLRLLRHARGACAGTSRSTPRTSSSRR